MTTSRPPGRTSGAAPPSRRSAWCDRRPISAVADAPLELRMAAQRTGVPVQGRSRTTRSKAPAEPTPPRRLQTPRARPLGTPRRLGKAARRHRATTSGSRRPRRRKFRRTTSARPSETSARMRLDRRLARQERERLAAGRRRGVENPLAGARQRHQRRSLAGLVLNVEIAARKGSRRQRVAAAHGEPERRERRRLHLEALVDQRFGQQLASTAVAKREQLERLLAVVGGEQSGW